LLLRYFFLPFLSNTYYLYSTEDIKQWKSLDTYLSSKPQSSAPAEGESLTPIELANDVRLQSWREGIPVGDLYPEENLKRIEELTPYLSGENWRVLFYRPLYLNIIYMNILIIGFTIL